MLDSSKLKEFADDNFKFDENGSKLSKRVENIVTSNFSFSHSVLKRLVSQGRQKVSLCGNGLNLSRESGPGHHVCKDRCSISRSQISEWMKKRESGKITQRQSDRAMFVLGPCSPNILKNILCIFFKIC